MFTGIVAAVGQIVDVRRIEAEEKEAAQRAMGVHLTVDAGSLDLADVAIGDSIAIQGACMTVVALQAPCFEVDVSCESLALTVGLEQPGPVNLEKALRVGDPLGGHLVSGHVDGIGVVTRFDQAGESKELRIMVPSHLGRYLAIKGSVVVDGVSLTVNRVSDQDRGCEISINLIPHTQAVTTLGRLQSGSKVNIEIDTIARYVERMVGAEPVVVETPVAKASEDDASTSQPAARKVFFMST